MNRSILNLFLAILVLLSVALPCSAKDILRTIEGTVSKVSDGDTIHVIDRLGTKVKVRFYGIDAPETEKSNKKTRKVSKPGQPFGEEAYDALRGKIYRQHVRLEVMSIDKYKRTVGIVWLDNRNINQEMVAEGWAWAYRQYLDSPYASEFIQLEERARSQRLGLWQQANPEPPWEFRHKLKAKGKRNR